MYPNGAQGPFQRFQTIGERMVYEKTQTCPYLDLADVRCSSRLTMKSLADAYRLCFGNPAACPVYRLLLLEGTCACNTLQLQEAGAA